jgi:Tfp pilus assembly protein PilO
MTPTILQNLWRQKELRIPGIVVVTVLFLTIWLLTWPTCVKIVQNVRQVYVMRRQIDEAQKGQAAYAGLEKKISGLETNLTEARQYVVAQQTQNEMLSAIHGIAVKACVRLMSIQPQKSQSGSELFILQIEAVGAYSQLGSFVNSLERSTSMMRIESFALEAEKQNRGEIHAEIEISFFQDPFAKNEKHIK